MVVNANISENEVVSQYLVCRKHKTLEHCHSIEEAISSLATSHSFMEVIGLRA